jgi:hypothetical protein
MARLVDKPTQYLKRHLDKSTRVLLINPPVQERRYHWLRWNQPMELLRLSSWIKAAHSGISVRLFDFMLPDDGGSVPKQKVKETWTGADHDDQLWHFGQSYEAFDRALRDLAASSGWVPDLVLISSLTSYWHVSIEKLLIRLCTHLGRQRRKHTRIALYGNYPRLERAHAEAQTDADVAFTEYVDTRGHSPDFELYLMSAGRLPAFCGLDINDAAVDVHLEQCLDLHERVQRQKGGAARRVSFTVAFFNDNVCSQASQLEKVVRFAEGHPRQLVIEGIAGIEPRSLNPDRLSQMKRAGFASLFVEHARLSGGRIDVGAYDSLRAFLTEEDHAKKASGACAARINRANVTGFVSMGLPDDDLDELVRATLTMNRFFQAVILKPFGYSPSIDLASEPERRRQWPHPHASSPQWFPYVKSSARLRFDDYENLVRWQNVLNKRVKGSTFDFLDEGTIGRLVRETLIAESWKRHREAS